MSKIVGKSKYINSPQMYTFIPPYFFLHWILHSTFFNLIHWKPRYAVMTLCVFSSEKLEKIWANQEFYGAVMDRMGKYGTGSDSRIGVYQSIGLSYRIYFLVNMIVSVLT